MILMVELDSRLEEIDTPSLIIDLDLMEHNIKTMADFFKTTTAKLRPHVKTHKCPIISHKQVRAGAIGVTCAKLGEAEVMVEAGISSVLIANQIVGETKIKRLINLAKHGEITVAIDDYSNVKHLARASELNDVKLNILIEVDVGNNRCGVPPKEPALQLAKEASSYSSLNFKGLLGYEGFCQNIRSIEERRLKTIEAMEKLVSTRNLLEDHGFDIETVSAGGTGTHMITSNYPGVTEIEAGSYVFMDATYSRVEGLEKFSQALTVLTTVVSTPKPSIAICDAGLKTISTEFGMPIVKGIDGVIYERASEEHGRLRVDGDKKFKVGDKLELVVTHCCTNTNLFDVFHCIRDGRLEAIWKIAARGRSQ